MSLETINEMKVHRADELWLFPGPRRTGQIVNIWKHANRIRQRSEVDFVPHDLRRTAASYMTSMGISRLVVGIILNHSDQSVTATYDRHSYDAEKRAALDAWGLRLEEIVSGESAADKTVVPLRSG